jgi:hypothetical protein
VNKYKHSTFPLRTEDNYLLTHKGFGNKDNLRRTGDSQSINNDGTSDTSSSVKETKMIRIIKIVLNCLVLLAVAVAAQTAVNQKFEKLKQAREQASPVTAQLRQKQLDCLARNIYHEAGGEPFEGKVAVAQVTMNRVTAGKFGSDVCGVVYQRNVFMEKVVCQFSWFCDTATKTRPVNQKAYNESYEVAKKVILEGFKLDVLKDALYYHNIFFLLSICSFNL